MREYNESDMQTDEYSGIGQQSEAVQDDSGTGCQPVIIQEVNMQKIEAEEPEVVFNESYEAEEVDSSVLSQQEDFEDEDELDRIPLETEPTMQEVMAEVQQGQTGEKDNQNMRSTTGNRNNVEKKEFGLGVTAMIMGILSILLFCVPVLGLVLAAMAIVIGIVAAARNNGKKMGTSGIIMGVISLASYLIIFLLFGGIFNAVNMNQDHLTDTAWRRTTDGSILYLYSDGTFIDVEREGVFNDNFYSGTYDVLTYEESGMKFQGIENQYSTDYACDVHLYVDTYVSDGVERDNIADTICYLYLFDKGYSDGDVVDICAHDSKQYGSIYPVKETIMAYPGIGNQYVAGESENELAGTESNSALDGEDVEDEVSDTTEKNSGINKETDTDNNSEAITDDYLDTSIEKVTDSNVAASTTVDVTEGATEVTTENIVEETTGIVKESTTENVTESTTDEIGTTTEVVADGDTSTESGSIWGDMNDFFEDAKDEFEEFSSSASEEWEENTEEISSVVEEVSSAAEEASSAIEEASSAVEEVEENLNTNGIQRFFEQIFNAIQNWLSKWGFN